MTYCPLITLLTMLVPVSVLKAALVGCGYALPSSSSGVRGLGGLPGGGGGGVPGGGGGPPPPPPLKKKTTRAHAQKVPPCNRATSPQCQCILLVVQLDGGMPHGDLGGGGSDLR